MIPHTQDFTPALPFTLPRLHLCLTSLRVSVPAETLAGQVVVLDERRIQPNPLHPIPHLLPIKRRHPRPHTPPHSLNPRRHARIKQPNHIIARFPIRKRRLIRHVPEEPQTERCLRDLIKPRRHRRRAIFAACLERSRSRHPLHGRVRVALGLKRSGECLCAVVARALQRNLVARSHEQRGRPFEARAVTQQVQKGEFDACSCEVWDDVAEGLDFVVVNGLEDRGGTCLSGRREGEFEAFGRDFEDRSGMRARMGWHSSARSSRLRSSIVESILQHDTHDTTRRKDEERNTQKRLTQRNEPRLKKAPTRFLPPAPKSGTQAAAPQADPHLDTSRLRAGVKHPDHIAID
ncbi:hypothetical protein OPT61_g5923 [Boeremia exigua]|uniref:Uncharacterized protein n=1 Tax=Boeremia exigua TaxID=749465 RepID=A0ACC2I8J8_9PLEO|nr:hypothetical protein OPT61_g5923 [Boeremia exigua]